MKSNLKSKLKNRIVQKKNILPALLLTLFFWVSLFSLIIFVNPDVSWAIPVFFALFFLGFFFLLSILFANRRRGFLGAFGLTLFSLLLYWKANNILNIALLCLSLVAFEVYFTKKD